MVILHGRPRIGPVHLSHCKFEHRRDDLSISEKKAPILKINGVTVLAALPITISFVHMSGNFQFHRNSLVISGNFRVSF